MVQTKRSKPGEGKGGLPAKVDPLGPTVLLAGEDQASYDRLAAQITAAVGPEDIIDAIWVRDIVDLVWETLRLRRLKVNFLRSCEWVGVDVVLHSLVGEDRAEILALERHKGSAEATAAVDAAFAAAGLTLEVATAQTFANCLNEVERIERMIALAESRKNAAFRELDRHRAALAQRLRRAAEVVQDAEFSVVPAVQEARPRHDRSEADERLGYYPGDNDAGLNRRAG
jgi:hypothetical protein